MSKMTGDLVEIGVAKESVRGTAAVPVFGLRWADLDMNDKAITSLDEGRLGILEDSRDLKVAGLFAEGSVGGPLRDQSIGLLLLSLFGAASDSTVEAGVYDHVFSVQQGVNHASLTIHKNDPNSGYNYPLGMVDSLEIDVEPNKHVMYKGSLRSKAGTATAASLGTVTMTIATPCVVTLASHGLNTGDVITLSTTGSLPTGLTPGTQYWVVKNDANTFWLATSKANALAGTKIATSGSQSGTHTAALVYRYVPYVSTENVFLPQHVTFKTAADQASLDGASAINVRSAKMTVSQEVEDDRALGTTAPADIVNKTFSIKLEVKIVRNADTYVTALKAGTAYATRLYLNNTDVTIGAASNPALKLDLHQAILQEADTDYGKGDLSMQTLVFKATYKESESKMITATLRNVYAAY